VEAVGRSPLLQLLKEGCALNPMALSLASVHG
jgi:hypothetical protein